MDIPLNFNRWNHAVKHRNVINRWNDMIPKRDCRISIDISNGRIRKFDVKRERYSCWTLKNKRWKHTQSHASWHFTWYWRCIVLNKQNKQQTERFLRNFLASEMISLISGILLFASKNRWCVKRLSKHFKFHSIEDFERFSSAFLAAV